MPATASPRHPWKALAVVLLVLVATHGARAHVFEHEPDHDFGHLRVVHADADRDCPDVDIEMHDDMDDDDGPDDGPFIDVIDGDDWN